MLVCSLLDRLKFYTHISKSWWTTFNIGAWRASSIDTRVSIVKLWVPRIHLLISASRFPSRRARSFCFIPLETRMSCILSTIWKTNLQTCESQDQHVCGVLLKSYFFSFLVKFKFPIISLSTNTIVPSLILDWMKRLVSIKSFT